MIKRKRFKPPRFATVIGEGTVIKGDLVFRDGLHIDGEVHGNLTSDPEDDRATLTLSNQGKVYGDVDVANVIINGLVEGDVYARSRVELAEEARITGKVHYSMLEMAMGAEINGQMVCQNCEGMSGTEELPEKQSAPEAGKKEENQPQTGVSSVSKLAENLD